MTVYSYNGWGTSVEYTDQTRFTSDDILIWFDIINEEDLAEVIKNHGIPGLLVSTAHPDSVVDFCKFDHWPFYLLTTSLDMQTSATNFDCLPINNCTNFLINKKQINRYLLLKLVEWFNLSSYDYTWSGIGRSMDLSALLVEFDQLPQNVIADLSEFKSHILSPVKTIPDKFISSADMINNNSFVGNYGDNIWTWNTFLGQLVSQSAVSLISESIRYEKYMVYTEKTLYAVHGLTFPIWIGGYKQAERWAKKGFDTFDDIINHDYQHCDTLLERCTRAFADNIQILTDLNFAREQKVKNLDRLRKNRELLVPIFKQQDQDFWKRAPAELVNARPK